MISDLLAAMADPAVVDEHWRRICREMASGEGARRYEQGLAEGYVLAIEDLKAMQHGVYRDALLEQRRWHLCCRRCRLKGHREGCQDCKDRTRETFSQPVAGESTVEMLTRARTSWEPLGLPPEGMVYLSGPVVHWHQCKPVCYQHKPGWYTYAEAADILGRLPGDYRKGIEDLRRKAAEHERRPAA